jgi:anthranilate synthase component 1
MREIASDTLTIISAYYALQLAGEPCFLLEHVEEGFPSRYSYLYFSPYETFRINAGKLVIERDGESKTVAGNPLFALKQHLEKFKRPPSPDLPPSVSGTMGYVGYDCIQYLEKIVLASVPSVEDEACLITFRNVLVFDRVRHRLRVFTHIFTETEALEEGFDRAQKVLGRIEHVLKVGKPAPPPLALEEGPSAELSVTFAFHPEPFKEAITKVKEHIRRGDIFQCVLSNRMTVNLSKAPFEIYRTLRTVNPSPFLYYFEGGGQSLLGASPEALVVVNDGKVETCPIAGTRPRGTTEKEDRKREENLLASPKERAEHIMLVDLGRNDLGRVCRPGTVKVPELMKVQRFSHVMHLVSIVEGELGKGKTAWDALFSCFPAGTLSGAPKIRAMEILSSLEPRRRGAYGGAVVGYDFNGDMDSCIIIRSLLVKDGVGNLQAGGGVVADSTARGEYDEIQHKARAIRKAIEMAEGRPG